MAKQENSAKNQRNRLLAALRNGPLTTLEIRHQLDILGVAPRVFELRHNLGHNIETHWAHDNNPGGGSHSVASYVLKVGKWKGGNNEK